MIDDKYEAMARELLGVADHASPLAEKAVADVADFARRAAQEARAEAFEEAVEYVSFRTEIVFDTSSNEVQAAVSRQHNRKLSEIANELRARAAADTREQGNG